MSPWEHSINVLMLAFTGPIARGLGLVAIVLAGLFIAFDTGDSKRTIAGVLFGVSIAVGAANFYVWLFQ